MKISPAKSGAKGQPGKLTTKLIQTLEPRERRYSVADGCGLTLRVHPSGVKTWVFRSHHAGRVVDETLGHWPEIPLKQARQLARRRRKEVGLVPPLGYVLLDAFRLWCSLKKGRIVSYQDEKRRIERYIMKDLGRKPIDEITAPMVIHHVRRIEAAGHQATLKRVLMRVREIMGLAVCAGYVQHNPLERISKVFAPPIVTPMPAPDWRDFPKVLTVMRNAPTHVRLLFAWSACSMLRPIENVSLRWDWIEGDVLTIPAEKMKKRRDFRVPLTPLMCELLESARKISHSPRSGYVFPSRRSGRHISEQTLAKYLHSTELSGVLVAHGLRSIARSFLADHDAPFEAAEMCLSHTVGTAVSRAYQRSDYLEARRGLLQHWHDYFLACARRAEFSLDFR